MARKQMLWLLVALTVCGLLAACVPAAEPTPTTLIPTPAPSEPTPVPSEPLPAPTAAPPWDHPIAFVEGFEAGLGQWQQGANVPDDPDRPGQSVAWRIEQSDEQATEGASSARFTIDGRQDDGTIWLSRAIEGFEPDSTVRVTLALDLWSETESFNTLAKVAVYAGSSAPSEEGDFDASQPANLAAGWRTYEYVFDTKSSSEGTVWVALGISAVWETEMTYYVDNVAGEIAPGVAAGVVPTDPTLMLPESAEPLHRASVDLDGDGLRTEIVVTGWGGGPDQLGYDFVQVFAFETSGSGEYAISWQSEQLPTDRAEPLQVLDLTGDGLPEVLSIQAMGASGQTLYVLGRLRDGLGWLKPVGGRFDGGDSFGENGARLEDADGDGLLEILGSYGPAAAYADVYGWDGQAFVYRETLGEPQISYERVDVQDAGLSLEMPVGWIESEPGVWSTSDADGVRLGVRWADLQPGQEPEPAVLPQPAQILDSQPVELAWGSGRRYDLEVLGVAVEGGGRAPVLSVESHVLVVIQSEGTRHVVDVYVGAPDGSQLARFEPAFGHVLASVVIK